MAGTQLSCLWKPVLAQPRAWQNKRKEKAGFSPKPSGAIYLEKETQKWAAQSEGSDTSQEQKLPLQLTLANHTPSSTHSGGG